MQHYGCADWACVETIFDHHNGGEYAGLYGWLAILMDAQDGDEVGAWQPLLEGWATGQFQRTGNGRIIIRQSGFDTEERTFALTGGKYPATEEFMFGQYGKYRLSGPHGGTRSSYDGFRFRPDPCNTWDCVALGLDVVAIGGEVFRDTSLLSTPVSGPAGIAGATYGQVVTNSATVAGVARTIEQRSKGNATNADVSVSFTLAAAGQIPILGPVAGVAQLAWDITAPAHPWR